MTNVSKEIYSVLRKLVDSDKRIDDKSARFIAQRLFGIDDALIESARAYKIGLGVNILQAEQRKIMANRYAGRDEYYLYHVKFGYDRDFNIIVYSEKIDVVKMAEQNAREE